MDNYPNLRNEYTTKVKEHWPKLGQLVHEPVDVEIKPTFKDDRQGNDAPMEYILIQ